MGFAKLCFKKNKTTKRIIVSVLCRVYHRSSRITNHVKTAHPVDVLQSACSSPWEISRITKMESRPPLQMNFTKFLLITPYHVPHLLWRPLCNIIGCKPPSCLLDLPLNLRSHTVARLVMSRISKKYWTTLTTSPVVLEILNHLNNITWMSQIYWTTLTTSHECLRNAESHWEHYMNDFKLINFDSSGF